MNKEIKKITFSELKKTPVLCRNIPQIITRPPFLWHSGYYDGPLSGYCTFNGKPHRFQCFMDFHLDGTLRNLHDRYFAIMEPTPEQWIIDETSQILFRDTVGWHTCYVQPEGRERMPRYPENTDFINMTDSELEAKTQLYYKGIAKNLKSYVNFDNNKVVAFWCDGKSKNSLLTFLKLKIKDLVNEQIENKKNRKTNNFYNSVCYYKGQEIRAHLIAYNLLRGKNYLDMEKNSNDYNEFAYDWIALTNNVVKICSDYSPVGEKENWTKDHIKQIFQSRGSHV
jgi:hypothetical protein